MRAVRFHGVGQPLLVEEVPSPSPGPGQVLIDVRAAGVCGTELHFLDGLLTPARTPITLGHEVAGVVAAVGADVSVTVGERVAVHYFHACHRCPRCLAGNDHLCDAPLGFLAFVTDGGFADQLLVPASAVVPVPVGLDLVDAAPLCCSATTALHAARVADLGAGTTALVLGAGGVGLALVQVLRLAGVRVLAAARSSVRRQLAAELGAEVIDPAAFAQGLGDPHWAPRDLAAIDLPVQVRELTGGAGVDAVFELVGTAATGAAAMASLAKGGAVVYVGYSFDQVPLSPLSLIVGEQRILTSVGNRRSELVQALDLAAAGQLRTSVTTAPLQDAADVLADLRAGRITGRAVLVP